MHPELKYSPSNMSITTTNKLRRKEHEPKTRALSIITMPFLFVMTLVHKTHLNLIDNVAIKVISVTGSYLLKILSTERITLYSKVLTVNVTI